MLRAVQQCPHVRLVPPGDVDHQHPCKARGKGQTGPDVIPRCQNLPLKTARRKRIAQELKKGGQVVMGSQMK